MSKAMAHYLVRKIHFEYGGENGKLVAWCVYPGYVALSSTFGTVMRSETRGRIESFSHIVIIT
jgi:hypothetical protein